MSTKNPDCHIPPSAEYFESFPDEPSQGLIDTPGQKKRRGNVLTRRNIFIAAGALGFAAVSVLGWRNHNTDVGPPDFNPDVAADYAYPPAGYEPICPAQTTRLKTLQSSLAERLIRLYQQQPNGFTKGEYSDIRHHKAGSFGNMQFNVRVGNGLYNASLILASDGKGGGDPTSAYLVDVGAAKGKDFSGKNIDIMLGNPDAWEDKGGPNFPPEGVYTDLTSPSSYEIKSWSNGSKAKPSEHQCEVILTQAEQFAEAIVSGMEDGTDVVLPAHL